MMDYDIDEDTIQNLLEPVYSYLASVLPSPIYATVESLIHYSVAFLSALFNFLYSLAFTQRWDSQKILPPLITLLMAYLALVSFYRTTGWMIRTTFWFVKWGGILAALAAGAGYFMGNQMNGGNGVGAFNGGLFSMLGSALLGMLSTNNDDGTRARSRSSRSSRPRAGTPGSGPKTRSKKEKERPRAWEGWDKHRDWQDEGAAARGGAERATEDFQETMRKMAGYVQDVLGTGWWESVRQVVEDSGLVGTSGESDAKKEETRSQRKAKQDAKGRGSSR